MIFRLVLFIIGPGALAAFLGSVAYRKLVLPRLLERDYRRLGALHARFTCSASFCVEYVDPSLPDSIFDHKKWWHRKCLQKTIS